MKSANISKDVMLCGTTQRDVVGRILKTGPLEVEFDNGQLRYLKIHGVEVLRAIGFLVRDENWGTYIPNIKNLKIDERRDGFSIRFKAVCSRPGQEISYDATIDGTADGNLRFTGVALPKTKFLTARTGFVVLHPLTGVAGRPALAKHVSGKSEWSKFPAEVNPIQPFLKIRSLTHEVLPGLVATVNFEGDTYETEDHRNWTDASFKTYVRPLALPWPYTLPAGKPVEQAITVTLSGKAKGKSSNSQKKDITIKLKKATGKKMIPVGFGVPAEEISTSIKNLNLVSNANPKILQCHFDPRKKHGLKELIGYKTIADATNAKIVLEIVVKSIKGFKGELLGVARLVKRAGLSLDAVAVCPVGDLKSVLPGGKRPPAPPLPALYRATRAAFPNIKLGGGMFSFFTELNRKRPPKGHLDFAMNATCPIVHAADDRSVMETLEALPFQIKTGKTFLGKSPHRVGPSAIGCRDNPHGATFTPNPKNERICLVKADPRTRGLFGASWLLGYIGTLAKTNVEAVTIGSTTGPLGVIHRKFEGMQPYFNSLKGPSVYPAYHVATALMNSTGKRIVDIENSNEKSVFSFALQDKNGGITLWVGNLTSEPQSVTIQNAKRSLRGNILDESSFIRATQNPLQFQKQIKDLGNKIRLKPYAVATICIE